MKIKVFYHGDDFDGWCSGAIIKYIYPDAEMYPMGYDDEFPWNIIDNNDFVYMLDFSLQPFEQMLKLKRMCNFVWIDHHQTAINEMNKYGEEFNGIQDSSRSAAYWTAKKFLSHLDRFPLAIKLIAEYDIWDHSDERTLPFQYGLKSISNVNPKYSMKVWERLFKDDFYFITDIIDKGKTILSYIKENNAQKCKACFEIDFGGLKCICLNHPAPNSSMLFESVWDNTKYDAMIPFYLSDKKLWCFSIYTDKKGINVGEIAKNLGGGGHIQAAGFSLPYLPKEFFNEN